MKMKNIKKIIVFCMFLLLSSLCFGSSAFASLSDDIVSYHTLNNNLVDSIGIFNGTINGVPTYSTGIIDNSINLSLGNNFYTAPYDWSQQTNFTFSFWIKSSSTIAGSFIYVVRDGTNFFENFISIPTNSVCIQINTVDICGTSNIINNNWNHIAITYNGTNTIMYVNDNIETNSTAISGGVGITGGDYTTMTTEYGYNNLIGSDTYSGDLDEFGMWNRTLSSLEIQQLYNNGNGLQYPFNSIQTNIKDIYNTTNISIQLNTISNVNMSYSLDSGLITAICTNCNNSILNLNNLTDSLHNILFVSEDENGQVNSSANFTIDTTSPIINNNINDTYYSYTFSPNSNSSCNDVNLQYCNISIDGQNIALNSSTITLTHNGNLTYNITASDLADNIVTESGTVFINPLQIFHMYDDIRNAYVSNFMFGNYSTTSSSLSFPLYDLGLGNHTLTFKKIGYNLTNIIFQFNSTSKFNRTYNITPVQFFLTVYSESSISTQVKYNLTIENLTNISNFNNQLNFEKYYNEIPHGELTLLIQSANYGQRKLFVNFTPYSVIFLKTYLLNNSYASPIVFQTTNLAQTQSISGVLLSFYKILNGSKLLMGQAQTDSQGYTYFSMDILGDYQIVITKSGYVTQTINSIPGKSSYIITLDSTQSNNNYLFQNFMYYFSPSSSIVNSTPWNATVNVIDTTNSLTFWNLSVISDNFTKTISSSQASGGSLTIPVTYISPKYTLKLEILKNNKSYEFSKIINFQSISNSSGSLSIIQQSAQQQDNATKIFISIVFYIIMVVLGSIFSPTFGAVMGLIPIYTFVYFGWLTIGFAGLFTLFTIIAGLYFQR